MEQLNAVETNTMEECENTNLKTFAEQSGEKVKLSEEDAIDNLQKHFANYAKSVTELTASMENFPSTFKKQLLLGMIKGLVSSEEDNMKRMNKLLIQISKKKTVVVYTEKPISSELQSFLGYTAPVAIRPNVQQFINEYIQSHSLQIEENKRMFRLDDTLATLFGKQKGEEFLKIQVNGLLSKHFIKN
jgi:chromatin remodeling complex protein RSC6